jgi:hypothetical protein
MSSSPLWLVALVADLCSLCLPGSVAYLVVPLVRLLRFRGERRHGR